MVLTINEQDYKVEYGYNDFCDTDLMDRVKALATLLNGEDVSTDADVSGLGKIKELFVVVRDLLFVGFRKHNPVETVQDIGNLLDIYKKEGTEENPHGLLELFGMLSEELMNEGFLSDLLKAVETPQNVKKMPTDHKKSLKK